jgi:hypothetical protein
MNIVTCVRAYEDLFVYDMNFNFNICEQFLKYEFFYHEINL